MTDVKDVNLLADIETKSVGHAENEETLVTLKDRDDAKSLSSSGGGGAQDQAQFKMQVDKGTEIDDDIDRYCNVCGDLMVPRGSLALSEFSGDTIIVPSTGGCRNAFRLLSATHLTKRRPCVFVTKVNRAIYECEDSFRNRYLSETEPPESEEHSKKISTLLIQSKRNGDVRLSICLKPLHLTVPMQRIEAGKTYHCLIDPFILKFGSIVCQHVFLVNVRKLSHAYQRNCYMPVLVLSAVRHRRTMKLTKPKSATQERIVYRPGDLFNVWVAGYIPKGMHKPNVELTLYSYGLNIEFIKLEYLEDLKKPLHRSKGVFLSNWLVNRCTNQGENKMGLRLELN